MTFRSGLTPVRAFIAYVATAALLLTLLVSPSGGDLASEPFAAEGTVTDANAPVPPTSFESEGVFKLGDPGLAVSPKAEPGVDGNGELTVHAVPTTRYYKDSGSGYVTSDYETTIVEGDLIRVQGRRVLDGGVYRFIAQWVWNGPPAPSSGGGGTTVPKCGEEGQMTNKVFRLHGTVTKRRVHIPCTTIGDQPGGFAIGGLNFINPIHAHIGVEAYGGNPDIYTNAQTGYYLNGQSSDADSVVKLGLEVRVDGRYVAVNGVYLFVATRVDRFTTPPVTPPFSTLAVREDLAGIRGSGDEFKGTSYNGGFFGGGDLTANLHLDGSTLTGEIILVSPTSGDELHLSISGTVVAHMLDATVTAIDGAGRFYGGQGMGSLEGTVMPPQDGGTQPQSFNAHLSINVAVPN
jgi:hypothetical protein